MSIIITRWINATYNRPDRVKGISGSGKSIILSAYDDSFDDSHKAAAEEVIRRIFKDEPANYVMIRSGHDKVDGVIWTCLPIDALVSYGLTVKGESR